jgi:ATP-dependent protease ClpP protease subunit
MVIKLINRWGRLWRFIMIRMYGILKSVKKIYSALFILFMFSLSLCGAARGDTFTHKETSESFNGFATQRTQGQRTLVYNADEKDFQPAELGKYKVERNYKGRRELVYVILVNKPEILVSKYVSDSLIKSIVDSSNRGPLFILLEINGPGGDGIYMRNICEAIAKTDNCTIISYVTSGDYSGAFAAAAGIALSCDKVFIEPTAMIGSISPKVRVSSEGQQQLMLYTYNPESLSLFRSLVGSIAEKHGRPRELVEAVIKSDSEIVQVVDQLGNKSFIRRSNRSAGQQITRSLSDTWIETSAEGDSATTRYVTNLTAEIAVEVGLANAAADNKEDIFEAMGQPGAKAAFGAILDGSIRKYEANKRRMDQRIINIEHLEQRADKLVERREEALERQAENTTTRRYFRGEDRRSRYYTTEEFYLANSRIRDRVERELVIETETRGLNSTELTNMLETTLRELIREYDTTLSIASRYPGTLPPGRSVNSIQDKLARARLQLNDIVNRMF